MSELQSRVSAFGRFFDAEPSVVVRAPGRVNLIGEHVDYNGGLVLPMAIERAIWAVAAADSGHGVRVYSSATQQTASFDLADIHAAQGSGWQVYPLGVAAELLEAGVPLTGARIYLDSDLPSGAGLASSAALEVAVAKALLAVCGQQLPDVQLAEICQDAEHRCAGVPCGIMDQMACAMSRADCALLIDCLTRQTSHIPWPDPHVVAVIAESQTKRQLAHSAYAERVAECAQALAYLEASHPEVQSLRDVTLEMLQAQQEPMEENIWRRARHVVTEIARTQRAVTALQQGDFPALGQLLDQSHDSLRDDYAVSSADVDELTAIIRAVPGVFGCRLTGAGFGGCVLALAAQETVAAIAEVVERQYHRPRNSTGLFMCTRPAAGASCIQL